MLDEAAVRQFNRDGYYFPVRALSGQEIGGARAGLEEYEARAGGPIAGERLLKTHVLFPWAAELVRHPGILDAIEPLLGPNILCWEANFIIKAGNDPGFLAWHQDSTYWGLDPPDVVTAWVAFTDSTVTNGAMRFIPGSHRHGEHPHAETMRAHNLTGRLQEAVDVDESRAVDVTLRAGEISLHHIRLLHASAPNTTAARRIGLAIRYVATHVKQVAVRESATLVRGVDAYRHFDAEPRPTSDSDPRAIAAHEDAVGRHIRNYYRDTDIAKYEAPNTDWRERSRPAEPPG